MFHVLCQMWEHLPAPPFPFPCATPPISTHAVHAPPLPFACKQGTRTQGRKWGAQMVFACHIPLLPCIPRLVCAPPIRAPPPPASPSPPPSPPPPPPPPPPLPP